MGHRFVSLVNSFVQCLGFFGFFARILRKYLFDGQVAGACGNGHVIFAHVIEKRFEWRDYEASVTGRKTIALRNVTNDAWEQLEFRDRIIQVLMVAKYLRMSRSITFYPLFGRLHSAKGTWW